VREARRLASQAGEPIVAMARSHTTVSVERAVLRLAGLAGADPDGMPLVNKLVDAVRDQIGLEVGVSLPAWDAMLTKLSAHLKNMGSYDAVKRPGIFPARPALKPVRTEKPNQSISGLTTLLCAYSSARKNNLRESWSRWFRFLDTESHG